MHNTLHIRQRRRQAGGLLIEALVAIMIFSLGIMGMIGLQATAVQQANDARYRSEAAQLVEQLIGEMWTTNRSVAALQSQFSCATCAGYVAWYQRVAARLPGVAPVGATAPSVQVDASGIVTVTVRWRSPSDPPTSTPHRYDTTAQIAQ